MGMEYNRRRHPRDGPGDWNSRHRCRNQHGTNHKIILWSGVLKPLAAHPRTYYVAEYRDYGRSHSYIVVDEWTINFWSDIPGFGSTLTVSTNHTSSSPWTNTVGVWSEKRSRAIESKFARTRSQNQSWEISPAMEQSPKMI
jgi:hypothetical protein